MEDVTTCEDIWCIIFKRILKEAIRWYQGFPKGSIHTFFDLKIAFRQAYSHQTRRKGHNATLLIVEQGINVTLREYIKRFASIMQSIDKPTNEVVVLALQSSLKAKNYATFVAKT